MSNDYLKKILTSKVYDVAIESPLEKALLLSQKNSNNFLLKREDMQQVFSFKLRGAYNKMANLDPSYLKNGVIASSAGNHAQGVALSAKKLGCRAVIVMPITTPIVKVDAVKRLGGEVVLSGESYNEAYEQAKIIEKKENLVFIHPFDDPDVIAGQGTVGMEILHQHPNIIDFVFIPIGGGGLCAGIASYIKQLRPEIKIIGVQTEDSDAMLRNIKEGKRFHINEVGLFADGTAVKLVGEETFKLVKKYVDDFIHVNTDEICSAIKDIFQDTRTVVEPSGAMSVAAAKKYAIKNNLQNKTLISIISGANINFDRLRFVAERANVGEMSEALFAVSIPEERGSFRKLCKLIGNRNVTEFNYRISDKDIAHVFVGIQITSEKEVKKILTNFTSNNFDTLDLSNNEMSKAHIRYMVGGKTKINQGELLFRFEFPEKPGALINFLNTLDDRWNISLFHYRNNGADFGNILIGIQVPETDQTLFKRFLSESKYKFWNETNNPAYNLFL